MSVKIMGTNIIMTRGDTLRVTLEIKYGDGTPYTPIDGDFIRFACKTKYDCEECLLYKEIPTDTLELILDPEDTKDLPQPSDYVYDIEIRMADGTVDTFIIGTLSITREVE